MSSISRASGIANGSRSVPACSRRGILEQHHRIDLVIEAFARFRAVEPAAALTIAGYGSEEPRLRASRLTSAATPSSSSAKSIRARCRSCCDDHDIFVNASTLDNQPVSILEACAARHSDHCPRRLATSRRWCATARPRCWRPSAMPPRSATASWPCGAIRTRRRRARQAHVEVANYSWPAVRARWDEIYEQDRQEGGKAGGFPFSIAASCRSRLPTVEKRCRPKRHHRRRVPLTSLSRRVSVREECRSRVGSTARAQIAAASSRNEPHRNRRSQPAAGEQAARSPGAARHRTARDARRSRAGARHAGRRAALARGRAPRRFFAGLEDIAATTLVAA